MSVIKKTRLNNKGFSHFELGLLIVVIAVIASVGMFVYNKNNNKSKADSLQTDTATVENGGGIPDLNNLIEAGSNPLPAGDLPNDNPAATKPVKGIRASAASAKKWLVSSEATDYRTGYRVDTGTTGQKIDYATANVVMPRLKCGKTFKSVLAAVTLSDYNNGQKINSDTAWSYVGINCEKGKQYFTPRVALGNNDKILNLAINSGNTINLTVASSGGKFTYTIKNISTNKSASYVFPCTTGTCERNAARAGIVRAYYKNKPVVLQDFDKIQFSNVKARITGQGSTTQTFGVLGQSVNLTAVYWTNTLKPGAYYLAYVSNPLMGEDADSFNAVFLKSN